MELPPLLNPFARLADDAPCWCLSSKPYASCHKDREHQRKANPQESLNLLSRQFKKKIGCLHPSAPTGCNGKIIDSHTIQKSGPLKTIAQNGEVYTMRGSIDRIVENKGKLVPTRKGISTVSTFPGFCGKHDNELFEPIENGEFEINRSNCFLLHYRNVCSEFHAKISMQFGAPLLDLMDGGREAADQFQAQQFAADMNFGASIAEHDLDGDRSELAEIWSSQDFSKLSFYFIEYDRQLPFVTSFAGTPKFSPGGTNIQDWSEDKLRGVAVSSINLDGKSGFVFSSTDHDLMRMIVADLEERHIGTPSTILRWVIANAENVAFEIRWWEQLSDRRRKHLLDLAMIGLPFDGQVDELETYLSAVEVLPPAGVARSFSF